MSCGAQLQPQPPPAPMSPPTAPSRMERRWDAYPSPSRGVSCIERWDNVPRCQGFTVTQPDTSPPARTSAASRAISERFTRLWCSASPRKQAPSALKLTALKLAIVLVLSGCVGSGEGVPILIDDPDAPPQNTQEILGLLDQLCAQACHRGGAAPKGLSLEPGRALQQMVGVASVEAPDLMRVEPGAPERSYLVIKLVASDSRRVGGRMPRGGPTYFTGAQVRALKAWIKAGAAEDWEADADVDNRPTPVSERVGGADTSEPSSSDATPRGGGAG